MIRSVWMPTSPPPPEYSYSHLIILITCRPPRFRGRLVIAPSYGGIYITFTHPPSERPRLPRRDQTALWGSENALCPRILPTDLLRRRWPCKNQYILKPFIFFMRLYLFRYFNTYISHLMLMLRMCCKNQYETRVFSAHGCGF